MSKKQYIKRVYDAEADAAEYAEDPQAFLRKRMKIIIDNQDDYILQVRAARKAIESWEKDGVTKEGTLFFVTFDDGSTYMCKKNKTSVRVYHAL